MGDNSGLVDYAQVIVCFMAVFCIIVDELDVELVKQLNGNDLLSTGGLPIGLEVTSLVDQAVDSQIAAVQSRRVLL